MKLDWQHVALFLGIAACATSIILLGQGNTLIQLLGAGGGVAGVASLVKSSPVGGGS